MPRTTREWAHRKLDSAVGNLEWAELHLIEVIETYQEDHAEISGTILQLLEVVDLLKKAINRQRVLI